MRLPCAQLNPSTLLLRYPLPATAKPLRVPTFDPLPDTRLRHLQSPNHPSKLQPRPETVTPVTPGNGPSTMTNSTPKGHFLRELHTQDSS